MTFVNEPLLELRRASVRPPLATALERLDERLPIQVPVIIGGNERQGTGFESVDPTDPKRVVANVATATEDDVKSAVRAAKAAGPAWRALQAEERAVILSRAAGIMRAQRADLAALEVRECAKPWKEADGDVAEAIDFLEYYAAGAMELSHGAPLLQPSGERNGLRYVPVGVVGVIAPWNFPIAIAAGMTAAALAVGNTVVLKPAEQSPACALAIYRALREAGLPEGVLSLLPGFGDVGAAIVEHPEVEVIAFTGSGEVGMGIARAAAEVRPGQRGIKKVVSEMGGKNVIIVDSDADLDQAVPAILYSAFGFAGQKCSAADRIMVVEEAYEALLERLTGAVSTLVVGPAEDFATDVPPVIDEEARDRIVGIIAQGEKEGRVVARQENVPNGGGYFCTPALIADLPSSSSLLNTEFFGPVVTIEKVKSVDAACDVIEGMTQALTGGLFARNPHTVARVVDRSPVGNLYINRAITGAMVGRQPFGGNRLSGTGSKAGGPDYLRHFVEPRVVTEDTTRHGLTL